MATHAVRINQRLLLEGSFEWTIECLELPQEQTSASAALTSQIDPKRTCRASNYEYFFRVLMLGALRKLSLRVNVRRFRTAPIGG